MDLSNEIAERYKKMSDSELLEVLQNPRQYQHTALSLARSEFASRQLSEKEIDEANQVLLAKKFKKEKQDKRIEAAKTKVMDAGNTLYETINPIQTRVATPVKLIRLITIVFFVLFIFKVIVNFDLFSDIINGDSSEIFGYTVFVFPILVELLAILLFWLRKQLGWTLLAAFCSYSLISILHELYYSILSQFQENSFVHFFPTPSPAAYIVSALFYTGTFFAMKRQDIREIYKIDNQQMQGSLIVGGLIAVLFIFLSS